LYPSAGDSRGMSVAADPKVPIVKGGNHAAQRAPFAYIPAQDVSRA
jgi:hypothetical protein